MARELDGLNSAAFAQLRKALQTHNNQVRSARSSFKALTARTLHRNALSSPPPVAY